MAKRKYRLSRNYPTKTYRPGNRFAKVSTGKSIYARTGVSSASAPLPFAQSKVVNLRYNDRLTLTGTSGLIDKHQFRANSLFDLDYTGTGHQPYAYDSYMALYSRYEVLDSTMSVTFVNRDNAYMYLCALSVQNGVSTPGDINSYIEGPNGKWCVLGCENSSSGKQTLTMSVKPSKYLGLALHDDSLRGTSGTSPDALCYFHLAAQTPQSAAANPIDVIVNITTRVKFSEPLKLAQS